MREINLEFAWVACQNARGVSRSDLHANTPLITLAALFLSQRIHDKYLLDTPKQTCRLNVTACVILASHPVSVVFHRHFPFHWSKLENSCKTNQDLNNSEVGTFFLSPRKFLQYYISPIKAADHRDLNCR